MKKSDVAKPFKFDISGVQRLVLRVSGGGDAVGPQGRTLADWVEMRLTKR